MQKLAEYLEHARQFERLAAEEGQPEIKAQFEKQPRLICGAPGAIIARDGLQNRRWLKEAAN